MGEIHGSCEKNPGGSGVSWRWAVGSSPTQWAEQGWAVGSMPSPPPPHHHQTPPPPKHAVVPGQGQANIGGSAWLVVV